MRASHLPVIVTALSLAGVGPYSFALRAEDSRDRLTPIVRTSIIADSSKYNRLLKNKLFVTPDEIARYVYLTNGKDGDRSAALYQAVEKKGAMPGNFWITATEASAAIPYPGGGEPALDIKSVTIQRYDAPLPASTAEAVHELWLAMLERSQPEAEIQVAPTAIFSATNPSGTKLRAMASWLEHNSISLALMVLGQDLINYTQMSAERRVKLAHEIEKESKRLLERAKKVPLRKSPKG